MELTSTPPFLRSPFSGLLDKNRLGPNRFARWLRPEQNVRAVLNNSGGATFCLNFRLRVMKQMIRTRPLNAQSRPMGAFRCAPSAIYKSKPDAR